MSEIGAVLVVIVIAAVPISFIVRCGVALFSGAAQEKMASHPGRHIAWLFLAVVAVAYFVVGYILTSRKAEDHQRRMAEQRLRPVSSEAGPSGFSGDASR